MKAGDFIDAASALAAELSPEARAALQKSWPPTAPHPAVVAHLLAVMLVDVAADADAAAADVSKGYIRARAQVQRLPPKTPPKPLGLAAELVARPGAELTGEAELRRKPALAGVNAAPAPKAG